MLTVVEGGLGSMVGTLLDRSEQIEQVFLLLKGVLFSYIIMGIIQPARKIKKIYYIQTPLRPTLHQKHISMQYQIVIIIR